ncbi:MAG: hypothetical protein JWQ40_4214 [Segetibacter sp.]|jgi:hypothetical protein|nr:hypothetical protein [Segetibacter sp.]
MMKDLIKTGLLVLFVFVLASCSRIKDEDQYTQLVKSELATGKRYDSIFFGIYLGMTAKEFFTHCWKMNKQGLFTDGRSNTAVLYKLNKNELKYPASMTFYPQLEQNKISKMQATFQYDGWAPWNKHMFADTLITDLLQLYKRWYSNGNSFIKMPGREKSISYVKVDGNRRITISKKSDMEVEVDYTDLLKKP